MKRCPCGIGPATHAHNQPEWKQKITRGLGLIETSRKEETWVRLLIPKELRGKKRVHLIAEYEPIRADRRARAGKQERL